MESNTGLEQNPLTSLNAIEVFNQKRKPMCRRHKKKVKKFAGMN